MLRSQQNVATVAAILRSYSTTHAARSARIAYWNDLHHRIFYPLEVKPHDRDGFDAAFSVADLGPAAVAKTSSSPATIERTDRHVASTTERKAFLLLPVDGPVHTSHYGHDAEVAVGDFVLTDSSMPLRTAFVRRNVSLAFMVPHATLARYVPNPEALFGRPVKATNAFGSVVGTTLAAIWSQVQTASRDECGANFTRSLLESVAAAFALEHRTDAAESSVASARRAQIKRFIEKHLRDATLSAHSVAAGLGLSPRYTRLLFAAEGEGIAEYILRRRLEECANQLTDTLWLGHSITETAFSWGFSSTAHFTRAFKERFTMTPSEYRRHPPREHIFTT